MWYKKVKDIRGKHIDADGAAYIIVECARIKAPDGKMNSELGFTEFENMEACLKAWELSPKEENGR